MARQARGRRHQGAARPRRAGRGQRHRLLDERPGGAQRHRRRHRGTAASGGSSRGTSGPPGTPRRSTRRPTRDPNRTSRRRSGRVASTCARATSTRSAPAFEDLLARFHTDHIELGMIHFVDDVDEFDADHGRRPVHRLRARAQGGGHDRPYRPVDPQRPRWRRRAALSGEVEMVDVQREPGLRPARPPRTTSTTLFASPTTTPSRAWTRRVPRLYAALRAQRRGHHGDEAVCGRSAPVCRRGSPFGVALTPDAVHPLRADAPRRGERAGRLPHRRRASRPRWPTRTPTPSEQRLRERARRCAQARLLRPVHLLRALRPLRGGHRHRRSSTSTTTWRPCKTRCPPTLRAHYRALAGRARRRLHRPAGRASRRCPFGVPIVERMEKAAALFA